ncbi:MAG: hypothetical protein IT324_21560 [Anaerolineae bacterium]|nr:hypothetical protein [Anaerolineae bacterium]
MKTIDAVLREQGFLETHYVKGRESIAALYQPDERCGIYVLHFVGDGSAEIGSGKLGIGVE